MIDRTTMLIQQQRIELALEITLAALLLAAVILGSVAAVQMLRHHPGQKVTGAFVVATLLTITCGAIHHQVRINHRIARERAIFQDERTAKLDLTDVAEDVQPTAAGCSGGRAEEVRP